MPYNNSSFDKLRDLELRRNMRQETSQQPRRAYQRRYPANTLGPSEDVLERRRGQHRKHVTITGAAPQNRSLLMENLLLLVVLAGSIWGLYTLTIYLLTHS
jgi:hypothetical protein